MTGPEHDLTVEQRIARLERLVEELRATVASEPTARARTAAPDTARGQGGPAASAGQGASAGASARPPLAEAGERWLGRVGVAFVILAFGFLFKYAFDQGWVGPAARVVVGFFTATAMLLVGLRLEGSRERYSQYLLGGAIGIFYLVAFAAYQLYELVPFPFAFAFMAATTVLAFVLAERQRFAALAVVGAAGGLATPFLLATGSGNVPGLTIYTTLLLAGAGTAQFWRGWRSLLLVLGFGGLLVMAIAVVGSSGAEDWIVLIGVLAAWALFGALPLLRAELRRTEPEAWPEPPLTGLLAGAATPQQIGLLLLRVGCVAAALIAGVEIAILFSLDEEGGSALLAGGFAVYILLAWKLAATPPALNAAAETAAILIVLAISLFRGDAWAFLPLAIVGGLMHLARGRWDLRGVGALAHVLFFVLALVYASGSASELGFSTSSWTLGPLRLSILSAIVTTFAASFALRGQVAGVAYRLGAHVALLLWLAVQFAPLEQGRGLTSLAWGIYGALLLLASFRLHDRGLQLTGLATLGIVAAKLLLIDMAQLDMIWRILLFMGFGSAFLGLSYLINRPEAER